MEPNDSKVVKCKFLVSGEFASDQPRRALPKMPKITGFLVNYDFPAFSFEEFTSPVYFRKDEYVSIERAERPEKKLSRENTFRLHAGNQDETTTEDIKHRIITYETNFYVNNSTVKSKLREVRRQQTSINEVVNFVMNESDRRIIALQNKLPLTVNAYVYATDIIDVSKLSVRVEPSDIPELRTAVYDLVNALNGLNEDVFEVGLQYALQHLESFKK